MSRLFSEPVAIEILHKVPPQDQKVSDEIKQYIHQRYIHSNYLSHSELRGLTELTDKPGQYLFKTGFSSEPRKIQTKTDVIALIHYYKDKTPNITREKLEDYLSQLAKTLAVRSSDETKDDFLGLLDYAARSTQLLWPKLISKRDLTQLLSNLQEEFETEFEKSAEEQAEQEEEKVIEKATEELAQQEEKVAEKAFEELEQQREEQEKSIPEEVQGPPAYEVKGPLFTAEQTQFIRGKERKERKEKPYEGIPARPLLKPPPESPVFTLLPPREITQPSSYALILQRQPEQGQIPLQIQTPDIVLEDVQEYRRKQTKRAFEEQYDTNLQRLYETQGRSKRPSIRETYNLEQEFKKPNFNPFATASSDVEMKQAPTQSTRQAWENFLSVQSEQQDIPETKRPISPVQEYLEAEEELEEIQPPIQEYLEVEEEELEEQPQSVPLEEPEEEEEEQEEEFTPEQLLAQQEYYQELEKLKYQANLPRQESKYDLPRSERPRAKLVQREDESNELQMLREQVRRLKQEKRQIKKVVYQRRPNAWVNHVKDFANDHHLTFGEALVHPNIRDDYPCKRGRDPNEPRHCFR